MRVCRVVAGLVIAFVARSTNAQTLPQGTLIPIPYRSYIGINPLGIPFDIGSLEFESAVTAGVTVGGAGSYTDIDNDRYTTADVKVRYYPGEVVLRGFSLGASAGYLHYSARQDTPTLGSGTVTSTRSSLDAPTLGVLVDYNWMLGTRRRFLVGTGVGAKRVIAGADARQRVGLDRAYLTGRFTVGLAF